MSQSLKVGEMKLEMKRSVGKGSNRYSIIELWVQVKSGATRNRRCVNPAEEPTDRPTRTWILLKIIPVARARARLKPERENANAAPLPTKHHAE